MAGAVRKLIRLALPALALLALVNAGCVALAVAGAAGAGAAVGYVYHNGLLYRDYHANLADSLSAVRSALVELHFPIIEQKGDTGSGFIKTRTADGHTVRIFLDVVPSPIPIEGALTRIGVRVGFSGDEAVSARILDQVSRHLVAPELATPTPSGASIGPPRPAAAEPTGVRPASFETTAPPLAPPLPLAPTAPARAAKR
jgi:hypothetical protein